MTLFKISGKLKLGLSGVCEIMAELTTEQIVTNLIASNEIIKPSKCEFVTSHSSLGEYLKNIPKNETITVPDVSLHNKKYSFIKNGKWKF